MSNETKTDSYRIEEPGTEADLSIKMEMLERRVEDLLVSIMRSGECTEELEKWAIEQGKVPHVWTPMDGN